MPAVWFVCWEQYIYHSDVLCVCIYIINFKCLVWVDILSFFLHFIIDLVLFIGCSCSNGNF